MVTTNQSKSKFTKNVSTATERVGPFKNDYDCYIYKNRRRGVRRVGYFWNNKTQCRRRHSGVDSTLSGYYNESITSFR